MAKSIRKINPDEFFNIIVKQLSRELKSKKKGSGARQIPGADPYFK